MSWTEKYRPKRLDNLILSDENEKIIKIFLDKKFNLILTGPYGYGKTSTALFLANRLYSKENIIKINGSDNRDDNYFNTILVNICKLKNNKIIIIDEIDNLLVRNQFKLNNIIENFTNHIFIIICNDLSRIINSLLSKCYILYFNNIPNEKIISKLKYILNNENINNTDDKTLEYLVKIKDIRKIINILNITHTVYNKITIENIMKIYNEPDLLIINMINYIFENNLKESLKLLDRLHKDGCSNEQIIYYIINNDFFNNEQKEKIYKNLMFEHNSYIEIINFLLNLLN